MVKMPGPDAAEPGQGDDFERPPVTRDTTTLWYFPHLIKIPSLCQEKNKVVKNIFWVGVTDLRTPREIPLIPRVVR